MRLYGSQYPPETPGECEEHEHRNYLIHTLKEINSFKAFVHLCSASEAEPKLATDSARILKLTKDPDENPIIYWSQQSISSPLSHTLMILDVTGLPKPLRPHACDERPIFNFHTPNFNDKAPNFDRLGVLYEFNSYYYTIFQCETVSGQTGKPVIQTNRLWLTREKLGTYVKEEWDVLPKRGISCFGVGVTSEWATGVHSRKMMQARRLCFWEVEKLAEAVDEGWRREGRTFTARGVILALRKLFAEVLKEPLRRAIAEEWREEEAMGEFIDYDQCEG